MLINEIQIVSKARFYERLHNAIRSVDDAKLIFWEPVTWAYVVDLPEDRVRDALIENIAKRYTLHYYGNSLYNSIITLLYF